MRAGVPVDRERVAEQVVVSAAERAAVVSAAGLVEQVVDEQVVDEPVQRAEQAVRAAAKSLGMPDIERVYRQHDQVLRIESRKGIRQEYS